MTTRSTAALLAVFVGLLGCSKDESKKTPRLAADLGEPVGAEVPAGGGAPAFSLALAVSKGQDPTALLPKVVSLVSTSMKGCPAFATDQKDEITAFPFTLEGGKLHTTGLANDSAGTKCMVAALDGKDLGTSQPGVVDGRLELKMGLRGTP